MRALLSVWDKTGLEDFARGLRELGFELVATGKTARFLSEAGLPVQDLSEITHHPEMLDGRVKTLHPAVYAGLLADRNRAEHRAQLEKFGYPTFEVVAVNLYPFEATIDAEGATLTEAIEQIDIGGVSLLRAAGKNFAHVVPVVNPSDYPEVLERLRAGTDDPAWRRRLAAKAFRHVAAYDAHIAGYLGGVEDTFPETLVISMSRVQDLRYGENPHQAAGLYRQTPTPSRVTTLVGAKQLHGKELSFNNLLDVQAALKSAGDYTAPTVSVVKHGNPCGLASAETLVDAYRKAHLGDPIAAFGGAVGLNRVVDVETARAIAESHYDDIIAPGYADEALPLLRRKRNLRILTADLTPVTEAARAINPALDLDFRRVDGGFLVQTPDQIPEDEVACEVVTERAPSPDELSDLRFAWRAVKHVKSNAIVLARDRAIVGVGAGQMSRVDAVDLAARKAGERARGSVLASDAYFPFPDGPEVAAAAGVTAIVQPGGSVRDGEVIRVANERGLAMVFTGRRHFRH